MGIPRFYGTWINQGETKQALEDELSNNISSLSIDFNALIYVAMQIVLGIGGFKHIGKRNSAMNSSQEAIEEQIIKITVDIMCSIVYYVQPKDTLIIAVDGVVPLGKVQQQKSRRYKPMEEEDKVFPFDKRCITPGTEFMDNLDIAVEEVLDEVINKIACRKLIYSSHCVEGEGEHKIFEYYRQGEVEGDGEHVIYGMDADLILLSLVSQKKNIILARESIGAIITDRTNTKIDIRGKDYKGEQVTGKNIRIDDLRSIILGKLSGGPIEDFALISSIIGNDFLPHPTCTLLVKDSMDDLINSYVENGEQLTSKVDDMISIHWESFRNFLDVYSKIEKDRIEQFYSLTKIKDKSKFYKESISKGKFNIKKYRKSWYTNAVDYNSDKMVDMSYQFIYGMAWTLSYYVDGYKEITWTWSYPYHHAPMIKDIYDVMDQIMDMDLEELFDTRPVEDESRFLAPHQLLAVIPRDSIDIVPKMFHSLYSKHSPLKDIMPNKVHIELDEAINTWQGVNMVPKADYKAIMEAIYNMEIDREDWEKWLPCEDIIYTIEDEEYIASVRDKLDPRPKHLISRSKNTNDKRGKYKKQPLRNRAR